MTVLKYLLFAILLFLHLSSIAQFTPSAILDSNIQLRVQKQLSFIDQYMLLDKSTYYNDDKTIEGYGQINSECFSIKVSFKGNINDTLVIKAKTQKIKSEKCEVINYKRILSLSSDSLSLKTRGDTYIELSHGFYWSMVVKYNESFKVFQAYNADIYQDTAPVEDRNIFLEQFNILRDN